jgi:hypothetical protein
MTNKAISCGTNNHNFQVAEDQNERAVIFCTKCGEVRPLELTSKEEGSGEVE